MATLGPEEKQERWTKQNLRRYLAEISARTKPGPEDYNLVASVLDHAFRHEAIDEYADLTSPISLNFGEDLEVTIFSGNGSTFKLNNISIDRNIHFVSDNIVDIGEKLFALYFNKDHIVARRLTPSEFRNVVKTKTDSANSLRPRWAEENRSNKQVKLRLDPTLLENIEKRAADDGLNRSEWITKALRSALEAKP
jgi:predicted DNA binding CopG/RHH family protein